MDNIESIVKKKRGRKPKIIDNAIIESNSVPVLKKRGRKPKNQLIENINTNKSNNIDIIGNNILSRGACKKKKIIIF
jgi:hypothetical protein